MHHLRTERGFTLVELMVTMVIAASVWLGVFNLLQTQMRTSMLTQDGTEMQSSVQAVMEILRRDILLAGMGVANANAPIVHANNIFTSGDRITLYTIAQFGSTINTTVMAGPLGSTGNIMWVRCFGDHGWGGASSVYRDAVNIVPSNGTALYLTFYSPFNGERITSVAQWNYVSQTDPIAGNNCIPNPYSVDSNSDGIADPAIKVTLGTTVAVPNGTVVYGLRWDGIAVNMLNSDYYVNPTTRTLLKSGVEVLSGVENMQIRYHVKGTPANQWLDVLTGVDTTMIDNVRVSLVVRQGRADPMGTLDPRTTITNYDQTFTIPDRRFPRETYEFFVRPVNNNYKGN